MSEQVTEAIEYIANSSGDEGLVDYDHKVTDEPENVILWSVKASDNALEKLGGAMDALKKSFEGQMTFVKDVLIEKHEKDLKNINLLHAAEKNAMETKIKEKDVRILKLLAQIEVNEDELKRFKKEEKFRERNKMEYWKNY
ncbi:unnamed protein product [Oikopleura dioica]|uniref:Uncharacterized protein n=1 Tax=Oikopleura dioica TaxID=34765 RepID=E4XAP9_OIKDI|nr:unnamed protein product [Oikopleura dioica]